ncbi:MAG TPA: neutral/alkaline non-lysosomal ceramidase N-terminal domain-containing protein [Candidatus Paceibacterota bacterium]
MKFYIKKIGKIALFSILFYISYPSKIFPQSPPDIFDLGVNFGLSEGFSSKSLESGFVRLSINRAQHHFKSAQFFSEADINFKFLLKPENLTFVNIEKTRIEIEQKLNKSPKYLQLFDLGVNLGQYEAFAHILRTKGLSENDINYLNKTVTNKAISHAKNYGDFKNLNELFGILNTDNVRNKVDEIALMKDNLERKSLALRLSLKEQLNKKTGFRAGVCKINLRCDKGEGLVGYEHPDSIKRYALHNSGDLSVTALVVENNNTKVAIVSIDALLIYDKNTQRIKAKVGNLIGLRNIIIIASHTHSGPEFSADDNNLTIPQLVREEQIVSAIVIAAGSLKEAEIGVGWGNINQGYSRVERFKNSTSKTKYVQICGNNIYSNLIKNAYLKQHPLDLIDNSIGIIKIQDRFNKSSIASLINYAMHPVVFSKKNKVLSADYVGILRKSIEKSTNAPCLFLQGAAGDIVPWCSTKKYSEAKPAARELGVSISKEVLKVSNKISTFYNNPMVTFNSTLIPIKHYDGSDRMPDVGNIAEINTLSFGKDIALSTFPGEMFVEHGLNIKKKSEFKNTFVIGYTNHAIGYIPTKKYFNTGGYGTRPTECYTAIGTGETLVETALYMLNKQKNIQNNF